MMLTLTKSSFIKLKYESGKKNCSWILCSALKTWRTCVGPHRFVNFFHVFRTDCLEKICAILWDGSEYRTASPTHFFAENNIRVANRIAKWRQKGLKMSRSLWIWRSVEISECIIRLDSIYPLAFDWIMNVRLWYYWLILLFTAYLVLVTSEEEGSC